MRVLGAIGLAMLGLPATAFADTGQLVATDGMPQCRALSPCLEVSECPGSASGEVCTTVGDPSGTYCNWSHNSFLCCTTADDASCVLPDYVGTCVAVMGAFTTTPGETDGFDGVCVFREGMPPDTFCGDYSPASIARCLTGPPGVAISWWDGDCDGDMFPNYEYPVCDPCDASEHPGEGCDVDGGVPPEPDAGGGRPDGGRVEPPMLSGTSYRGGGGCVCTVGPRREVGFGIGFATLVTLLAGARTRGRRRHTQP